MTESSPAAEGVAFSDPSYRAAVVDLLGVIAYGEIAAFERLAEDAKLAPDLADKVALATMASAELTNVNKLRDRLWEPGADPFEAIAPFSKAVDSFPEHNAPSHQLAGLVTPHVGPGPHRQSGV